MDIAEEMDFAGIEVYKLLGDRDLYGKGEAFNRYNIADTTRKLRDRGLSIPVFDGKYDLAISALAFTSGRAAVLEMSKGYYYTTEPGSSCILIRSECAGEIDEVEDLAERDIVAQSGSLQETMAAESIVFYRKFRRLATVDDVYQAVMTGKADAGIVDMENAHAYIEDHPDCGLAIVEDVIFTLQPQYQGDRVAAKKGEIQLICFVNGVIDEVLDSGLYNDWFEQYARYGQD